MLDAGDDVRARYYRLAIDQLVALQRFAAAHPDPELRRLLARLRLSTC